MLSKVNDVLLCKNELTGEGNGHQPPEGPKARGPTAFTRTYQLKKCPQKWMYVVADCDLTFEFENEYHRAV